MKVIHFIPHTHWDREWYRSSDAFRLRLVYSLDLLIDTLQNDEKFAFYTLDGQTCILEEYLELRPERRADIEQLVKSGKLLVGPWYTQPDLYLAAGESILRNLVIGSTLADKLGGCMPLGWIPDAFGQIQSTPQIFKALGMKAMFVWRGFNYRGLKDSAFMWQAPNGDELLSVHFPLGYGHYRYLSNDLDAAQKEVNEVIEKLEPRFHDDQLLFMGGSDHARVQPEVPQILEQLNARFDGDYQLQISNPLRFVESLQAQWQQHPRELDQFKGEARSADLGRIHAGISSTNIDYKNALKKYENLLARVIEPMSCLTHQLGGQYDQALTNYFWKQIFRNQFHDAAYQSSPETVNQSGYQRLLKLRHGLNELVWLNCRYLRDKLDFSTFNANDDAILLFNTLPRKRNDSVLVNLFVKTTEFTLFNQQGIEIPYVRLQNITAINNEIEHYNGLLNLNDIAEVREGTMQQVQIRLSGEHIPALGYLALKVVYGQAAQPLNDANLWVDGQRFGNNLLDITIENNGSLSVTHQLSGETYRDLLVFEDKGDDGDEYNYSPPRIDQVITTQQSVAEIRLVEATALQTVFEIRHKLSIPARCENHDRVNELAQLPISTYVKLDRGSEVLQFDTHIDNQSDDHMVRVLFSHNHTSQQSLSEDHFGSILRRNHIDDCGKLEDGATELELPIYPMQRFVTLPDTPHTLAVLSSGPCDYEIYNNQTMSLTLLRAVGMFGKADLTVRPGRASGYRLEAPSSQLHKVIYNHYAISFAAGQPDVLALSRQADELNVPIQARHMKTISRAQNKGLAWQHAGFAFDNLELLAMKRPENNGPHYIVRLLNRSEKAICEQLPTQGHWYHCSLREELDEQITTGCVNVKPKSFITLAWVSH